MSCRPVGIEEVGLPLPAAPISDFRSIMIIGFHNFHTMWLSNLKAVGIVNICAAHARAMLTKWCQSDKQMQLVA